MDKASEPVYKMIIEKNVTVTARDGIKLACDVYRPDADGQFPALFSMSPYGKDIQALKPPSQPRYKAEWGSIEAGDIEYFVSRGYAHIIADARGTGYSEGKFDICHLEEQESGYDIVEWIAEQPWCTGNVGMVGVSYFGLIQYLVAQQQPPHLKAIFPHDAWGDMYRDISHQGGILLHGWLPVFSSRMLGWGAVPAALNMYTKEELEKLVEKWKQNPSLNIHPEFYNALLFPQYRPILFDWVINEFDGPYYWERSAYTNYDKINIPAYLGSEMHSYPVSMHLPGAFSAWEGIKAPKKLAIRPEPPEVPFHDFHDEIIRWYDYWLKGIDNGIMDEPPIKIWVREQEDWYYGQEWPLTETVWTDYYLSSGKTLTTQPAEIGEAPDTLQHKPVMTLIQSRTPLDPMPEYLSYETLPLEEDLLVIGQVALYLQAALSGEDGDFIVKLKDVSPDGPEFVLSRGWLKASHRELDTEKSKPWQPFHPHTRAVPVTPGEINEYAIEIRPIANLFRKGHRIKLEIWGCDYPSDPIDHTLQWPWRSHLSYEKEVGYEIYHNERYQSRLRLPVICAESA